MLVLSLAEPPIRLSCPRETPGGRQLLMMAGALAAGDRSGAALTPSELYVRAMLGQMSQEDVLTQGRRLQLPMKLERCLFVFQSEQPRPQGLLPMLETSLPL